jgi:transcriptional regulator with XRE-family HTH domain
MATILGVSAFEVKAHPHRPLSQDADVPKTALDCDTPPETLNPAQAAIWWLVKRSRLSVNAWAKKHLLTQTTINRIVNGELDPTYGLLAKIAQATGMEAWQLLHPQGKAASVQTFSPEATKIARRLDSILDPKQREWTLRAAEYAVFSRPEPQEETGESAEVAGAKSQPTRTPQRAP